MLIITILLVTEASSEELEISFTNEYDNTRQFAMAYIPEACTGTEAYPLLVVAHFMGGNQHTAKNSGYYPECDERGWLCVCPELHGTRSPGQISSAAIEAQYDVIGAIEYMKAKYNVDTTRVYIVGRSMGGMLTQVMLAKYPDLFAAGVSGQGISDLPHWYETTIPSLKENIIKECGPLNDETRFDYERRSSVSFAPNLAYVSFILWHGTNDTWVPPDQSERIVAEVRKYNRFQPDVHWLHGAAHCPTNYTASWVCDQLTYYQNVPEAGYGTPTRFFPQLNLVFDEAKRIYWLDVTPGDPKRFARVNADIGHGVLYINAENISRIDIDMAYVSKKATFNEYDIEGDTDMVVRIVRDGNVLFETTAKGLTAGKLPTDL